MTEDGQTDLLSPLTDLGLVRLLLADLYDDLDGKVARFRQLSDLSASIGFYGAMLPGEEAALGAWTEARTSFVQGNYIATVMLCQSLAEHMLAAHLSLGLQQQELPKRIRFPDTLERCLEQGVITVGDARELRRLMELRNPFSHFRGIDDPSNLSRRVLDTQKSAESHLFSDASFAIGVAIRLLALPIFRIDDSFWRIMAWRIPPIECRAAQYATLLRPTSLSSATMHPLLMLPFYHNGYYACCRTADKNAAPVVGEAAFSANYTPIELLLSHRL